MQNKNGIKRCFRVVFMSTPLFSLFLSIGYQPVVIFGLTRNSQWRRLAVKFSFDRYINLPIFVAGFACISFLCICS